MKSLLIPLPPLPEQRDIARVLCTVQQAMEATERVIQATRELKKSLMRHLFTYGPVPVDEAERVPLKETEVGLVPEHWKVVHLGEMATITMGQSPPSSTYNVHGKGLPFLQGKAEFGETYPFPVKWCTAPKQVATPGSVLISVRAPVGDVNIANEEYAIGRGLAAIKGNSGLDNWYLFYHLILSKSRLEDKGTGSTFKSINKGVLHDFIIPIPSLSEQREIARILGTVDKKFKAEEARKQALDTLFKTLLNNLMTGKIRVKDIALSKVGEVV